MHIAVNRMIFQCQATFKSGERLVVLIFFNTRGPGKRCFAKITFKINNFLFRSMKNYRYFHTYRIYKKKLKIVLTSFFYVTNT